MVFRTKTIKPDLSLGQRLSRARAKREITLEQAEHDTLIRAKYLRALEEDNWNVIPGRVYLQGYLRRYADYLEFDGAAFVQQFMTEFSNWATTEKAPPSGLRPTKSYWAITPKTMVVTLVLVAVMSMIGYIGYQIHQITAAPTLVILAPGDQVVSDTNQLEIVGKTSQGAVVYVNNQNVMQDNEGNFRQLITLQSGINTIEITAKSRFDKQTSKIIKILKSSKSEARSMNFERNSNS